VNGPSPTPESAPAPGSPSAPRPVSSAASPYAHGTSTTALLGDVVGQNLDRAVAAWPDRGVLVDVTSSATRTPPTQRCPTSPTPKRSSSTTASSGAGVAGGRPPR
jgi:hypothetical protein